MNGDEGFRFKNCLCSYFNSLKVVKITDLGQRQKRHKMLQIQQIFPKLYRCLLYVVFHNPESENAGLRDVEKDLNKKRSKGNFVRENLKNKHRYQKRNWV